MHQLSLAAEAYALLPTAPHPNPLSQVENEQMKRGRSDTSPPHIGTIHVCKKVVLEGAFYRLGASHQARRIVIQRVGVLSRADSILSLSLELQSYTWRHQQPLRGTFDQG